MSSFTFQTDTATVVIDGRDTRTRTYALSTTAALRDDLPASKRVVFTEAPGQMILRTGNDLFDALFALAMDETRQNSVSSITDGAFNGGAPVPCECFETGEKWHYVWTRDTAYASHLALALVDPLRARDSLAFKLSARKAAAGGGDVQIVQDTGSGGSYPVSSDRVVWALGAREVLAFLEPAARQAFRAQAYEAVVNTIAHDRLMVHDPRDGLYRGEQSFLDWREQSYPLYTREDTAHIAMSKALSTNVGHLELLRLAADLAAELGDSAAEARYRAWTASLARSIHGHFWLDGPGQYSTMKPTELDPVALEKYDLLGTSLAVLAGIAPAAQAERAVAGYPRTDIGPPVLWPQQPSVAVYHNRAVWPFATAYALLAARQTKNAAVIDHDVDSLVRGAALNLSNMENYEFTTGASWLDDGPYSGPVVNSRRQLWSVAGYLAMVSKVLFGLETTQSGIRFRPMVTRAVHRKYVAAVDRIQLLAVPYRGKLIDVEIRLPDRPDAGATGYYTMGDVTLDGAAVGDRFIDASELSARSLVSIALVDEATPAGAVRVVTEAGARDSYAPRAPVVQALWQEDGLLHLDFHADGDAGVVFNIYRDGVQIAAGLAGGPFTDPDSGDHATATHCYAVESELLSSGHRSHHSPPTCDWGAAHERIEQVDATGFVATGGAFSTQHGRPHYRDWGAPSDVLEVPRFQPRHTGAHYVRLVYSNGAGPVSTGITAAVKWVVVEDALTGAIAGQGPAIMPQRGDWSIWADSTLVPVTLDAARTYRVRIEDCANMSYFEHFRLYGGAGGDAQPYNRVAIAALEFLALGATAMFP